MRRRARKRSEPDISTDPDAGHSDIRAVRKTAMNLLARREHSTLELSRKLELRDFGKSAIGQVLAALASEGLLSDQRFAESFVGYRVRRGQGPLRIRRDLDQRGIKAALIEQELALFADEWVRNAVLARQKRFGAQPAADFNERARQARFLQYRGFAMDQIMRALDEADARTD